MKRIVLIDDSEMVLESVAIALEDAGFDVTTMTEPNREEIAGNAPASLILMDVNMPQMFGDDMVDFLQEAWGVRAPLYLFSDIPEDELRSRSEEAGADGYLCKGWGMDRIVDTVRSLAGADGAAT